MSYHILHLLEPGTYLKKERGRLVGDFADGSKKSLPIENIKAIIAVGKNLTFSSQLIGELLQNQVIVLFCNKKYQPSGWLTPFSVTIHPKVHQQQFLASPKFNQELWTTLIKQKFYHQQWVLQNIGLGQLLLDLPKNINQYNYELEAKIAKNYFRSYYGKLSFYGERRSEKRENSDQVDLNLFLNYGYAILSSFIHRSLLVHGFIPLVGIKHKARYNSYPLVYDIMEPLRPVIDFIVAKFVIDLKSNNLDGIKVQLKIISDPARPAPHDLSHQYLSIFIKFTSLIFSQLRFKKKEGSLKLIDAIDFYIRSLQVAFLNNDQSQIWVPDLNHSFIRD